MKKEEEKSAFLRYSLRRGWGYIEARLTIELFLSGIFLIAIGLWLGISFRWWWLIIISLIVGGLSITLVIRDSFFVKKHASNKEIIEPPPKNYFGALYLLIKIILTIILSWIVVKFFS